MRFGNTDNDIPILWICANFIAWEELYGIAGEVKIVVTHKFTNGWRMTVTSSYRCQYEICSKKNKNRKVTTKIGMER